MSVLKVCKYPHPILKRKADPVEEITERERRLIEDMIETMRASDGVGLAANQVGVAKRIFVYNPSRDEWRADALINPVIIKQRGSEEAEEGCLSLPGISRQVRRYAHIVVEGLDINSKAVRFEAKGLLARIIQHETDHLNGILLIERINPIRRVMALHKLKRTQNKST